MNDHELKNIDDFVIELRKMGQAIYLACDAEIAADVSLKTDKACRLINKLTQENCAEMDVEENTGVADIGHMLRNAEQHIHKLTCELKEKECAISEHVRRWRFYEQIVKNLTTFK